MFLFKFAHNLRKMMKVVKEEDKQYIVACWSIATVLDTCRNSGQQLDSNFLKITNVLSPLCYKQRTPKIRKVAGKCEYLRILRLAEILKSLSARQRRGFIVRSRNNQELISEFLDSRPNKRLYKQTKIFLLFVFGILLVTGTLWLILEEGQVLKIGKSANMDQRNILVFWSTVLCGYIM